MSVTAAPGFEAAGVACGIKESGALDVALVATAERRPVSAAGVFTANRAPAAPVQVSREHLDDGRAAAVVLSSGNANAATGEPGRRDARHTCARVAEAAGCAPADVLVCSTGLIGFPLPMDSIEAGVAKAAAALGSSSTDADRAADAILTTDTVRKTAVTRVEAGAESFTVGGMAKGAAMLSPAMATMLAVITTDAAAPSDMLGSLLRDAVADSFNMLVVDGAMSTNDTVLVLASGAVDAGRRAPDALGGALAEVCCDLARQMATDAEGATKLARVVVRGARTTGDARRAARAVAVSQLVQCSLNGEDPYWGRVLSELGASGADLEQERVEIAYGDVVVCRDGVACAHDAEILAAVMAGREIDVVCDLHLPQGRGEAEALTTDLSPAYIDENRRTS